MADTPAPNRPPEQPTVHLPGGADFAEPPTVDLRGRNTPADHAPLTTSDAGHAQAMRPFGDYELLGEIQRGGMGVVYRARERHSGRLVALKMMLDETIYGEADLRRFVLEARSAAGLQHPGIVAIHAWGEQDGHPFYTMDFVSGVPLSRLLQAGPLPVERAVRYLLGIAQAVAAAHAQGIVHRDLKPGNVMIDAGDQPRVLDFGLAKRHRARDRERESASRTLPSDVAGPGANNQAAPRAGAPATQKGAILGTPAYMAPEQARGQHDQVSPATDIHALGAIFYEMLAGHVAFQGSSTMETLLQVADHTPPPLRRQNPRVPAALEALCARCLAKDAAERFADAGALAAELEAYQRGAAQSRRFARLAASAGLLVLLLQVLQFATPGSAFAKDGWLFSLAASITAAGGPTAQEAAQVLAVLAGIFVFQLLPALAWLALIVWLGAWVWYSDRGFWAGVAAVALAPLVWLVWLGLDRSLLVPAHFTVAALTAFTLAAVRRWAPGGVTSSERSSEGGEPYLQRLFAVRGERTPGTTATMGRPAVKLADVEPGRTLFQGSQCLLRWGRQTSLDRPVLIWLDKTPAGDQSAFPGVLVRHPLVLTLHAVGASPEGRFLVTESAAAAPLAEVVERRPLAVGEAVVLASHVARALQAFHDQGACHGRLNPEWVLVRGDCEPLLCPCGLPGHSPEDRRKDMQDLAGMLQSWLPPRRPGWQRQSLAALYRVCDAAAAGSYDRAADLADDLDSAAEITQARGHERTTNAVAAALYLAALLPVGGILLARSFGLGVSEAVIQNLAEHLLLAFVPGIALFGYGHARTVVHRLRRPLHIAARSPWLGRRTWQALLIVTVLAAVPAALATVHPPPSDTWAGRAATFLLSLVVMSGCWGLGLLFAGVRSFGEVLFGSLRQLRPEPDGAQGQNPDRNSPGTDFAA